MPTVPRGRRGALAFFGSRITKWTQRAGEIGLTDQDAALLSAALEAARAAEQENQRYQAKARAAAREARRLEYVLRRRGGRLISVIRAKAKSEDDPGVLVLAELPKEKAPRPTPRPSSPTSVRTHVDNDGAIVLAWQATRPRPHARAFTRVERMLDGSGRFELLGTSGTNEYRDETLPEGTREVAYRLTPVRGDKVGTPAEAVDVRFGTVAA
ncbi:MAG: hypothetical protein RIE77_10370 [Phycisphaerales bacterium]|jgi:hypothetical protein